MAKTEKTEEMAAFNALMAKRVGVSLAAIFAPGGPPKIKRHLSDAEIEAAFSDAIED